MWFKFFTLNTSGGYWAPQLFICCNYWAAWAQAPLRAWFWHVLEIKTMKCNALGTLFMSCIDVGEKCERTMGRVFALVACSLV